MTNLAGGRLGTVIANYAYGVGAAGNRTNATEQLFGSALNSQTNTFNRVYTYDALYRLWPLGSGGPESGCDFPSAVCFTYFSLGRQKETL